MPVQSSYVGVTPRTAIPTVVALARGVRVTRNSSGLVAVQDASARGDYVTATACDASEPVCVFSMQDGGKVPVVASEATTVGAAAYTAANGQCGVTSTSAVLVGRWTQAASGAGVLGEIELLNPL